LLATQCEVTRVGARKEWKRTAERGSERVHNVSHSEVLALHKHISEFLTQPFTDLEVSFLGVGAMSLLGRIISQSN